MVRLGKVAENLAGDEARLLEASFRSSPLENAMRVRALEEIARTLDTSALVELAARVSEAARDEGGRIAWI